MKVYEAITQEIIKKLEQGVIPWQKSYIGFQQLPMNFKTKNTYKGINALLLFMTGKRSPYYLTYKQAQSMDGQVRKGSKGFRILFAKSYDKEDKEGNVIRATAYRYSIVFSLDDIDGIDCPYINDKSNQPRDNELIQNCENLLTDLKENNRICEIEYHNDLIAYYNPGLDIIRSCDITSYISSQEYYGTLFHEIIHCTGHKDRMDRNMNGNKKTKTYAKEELIAEIGSCFLCYQTGIMSKTIENSVSYINGWLQQLKDDPTLVVSAASHANKAVDYLNYRKLVEH